MATSAGPAASGGRSAGGAGVSLGARTASGLASTTGGGGAIVELRCETDYVAKSGEFRALVDELARAVAVEGEEAAKAQA
ncbi:MAG TPA: hypothetical protein VE760_03315, partial [Acidimicrobiales bacterium]|nr:hypothetical protein [Acidimicrobiales bacterium]